MYKKYKKILIITCVMGASVILSGCSAPAISTQSSNVVVQRNVSGHINLPTPTGETPKAGKEFPSIFSLTYDTDRKRKQMKINIAGLFESMKDTFMDDLSFA